QQREMALRYSRWWCNVLLLAGGAASAVITLGIGIIFNKSINQRFAMLTDNARRLAAGKTLVPPLHGNDEIAELDHVFHEMRASLAEAAQRERDYTGQLEQRVAERTAELTAANRDLAHKNQENELFVYSVSHDLRS